MRRPSSTRRWAKPEAVESSAAARRRSRASEHPGILFRDGRSGRRAALIAGPDVWEVVSAFRSSGAKDEKRGIAATAATMSLTSAQIQLALDYYGVFPTEIDEQIAENERAAADALAAWRARQRLLA